MYSYCTIRLSGDEAIRLLGYVQSTVRMDVYICTRTSISKVEG